MLIIKRESISKGLINLTWALYIIGGQALSLNLGGRITLKLGEIFALIVGPILLVTNAQFKADKTINSLNLWIILAFGLSIVSTVLYGFSIGQLSVGLLYLFRFWYAIYFARISAMLMIRLNCIEQELDFALNCYYIVCLIGFFQLIFFPIAYDWYQIFYNMGCYFPNPDPHIGRFLSTYFDPNFLAGCLMIPIAISFYKIRREKKAKYIIMIFIFILCVFLTKSRSGLLGLGVLFGSNLILSGYRKGRINKKSIIYLATGGAISVYLLLFSNIEVFKRIRNMANDPSAKARGISWGNSFGVIMKNPIGLGYNMYGAYNSSHFKANVLDATAYGVDSSLLLIVISTGLIGLFILLAHFYIVGKKKSIPPILKSLLISGIVMCNFNNLLFYTLWVFPSYMILFLKYYDVSNCENATKPVKFNS